MRGVWRWGVRPRSKGVMGSKRCRVQEKKLALRRRLFGGIWQGMWLCI